MCAVVVDTDGHDVRCIEKSAAFALGPAGGVILGMFYFGLGVPRNAKNTQRGRNRRGIILLLVGFPGPWGVMLCCGVRPVRKSFAMRSYKKYARKRPGMSRYEIIGLKVPWNEQLQERGGGAASSAVPTGRLGRIRGSDL